MKKRTILWVLALFLLITKPAYADSPKRIEGSNRFETAVQISKETFETSRFVLIANGRNYVDALPASTLANHLKAPILLTEAGSLPEATLAEITRLGAEDAYVLGGETTVDPAVVEQLRAKGLVVSRIGGADRYETSELILDEIA